jgi:SAM-dependent methyltransferase
MQHDVSNYTESHIGKGEGYDEHFESRPGRKLMWQLEQRLLARLLEGRRFYRYLDFACGTGRILRAVAPRADHAFGVDISDSMLDVARSRYSEAEYVKANIAKGLPHKVSGGFDLVTAFRFFPNAEPDLRNQAMQALSSALVPGGRLIVNNHRNLGSISYAGFRLTGKPSGHTGMTDLEMRDLIAVHSLKLVERYSLGVLPQSEKRSAIPWGMTSLVEQALLGAMGSWHGLGYNLIYVLERSK